MALSSVHAMERLLFFTLLQLAVIVLAARAGGALAQRWGQSAVVGEILSSHRGLGYVMNAAAADFDIAGVFAGIFLLALIVGSINAGVAVAERRWLAWRQPSTFMTGDARGMLTL